MSVTTYQLGSITANSKSIASSTNATPISIHIVAHGFTTGDIVFIMNHATNTAANGTWTIIVTGVDDFTLTGSVGNGVGGATGTVLKVEEASLVSVNEVGEFSFSIDLSSMVANDTVELRIYQIIATGTTKQCLFFQSYNGVQPAHDVFKNSLKIGNTVTDTNSLQLTYKQITGSGHNTNFKCLKYSDPATVNLANPQGVKKNTALNNFEFMMYDTTGAPKTGLTSFTRQRSLDGAAYGSIAGAVTEIASGLYKVDLVAGDLNADIVNLRFAASGGRDTNITIKTVVS